MNKSQFRVKLSAKFVSHIIFIVFSNMTWCKFYFLSTVITVVFTAKYNKTSQRKIRTTKSLSIHNILYTRDNQGQTLYTVVMVNNVKRRDARLKVTATSNTARRTLELCDIQRGARDKENAPIAESRNPSNNNLSNSCILSPPATNADRRKSRHDGVNGCAADNGV